MMRRLPFRIVLGSLAATAWGIPPAGAVDPPAPSGPPPAAMRAYVDPQTGKLTTPPASAERIEAPGAQATGDLTEEVAPGGGTMVHLHGRFARPLVVTVDPGGRLRVGHTGDRPDAR